MRRLPHFTKLFRRHYRKLTKSHRHRIEKLDAVLRMLIRQQEPNPQHHDHALHGEWDGCRDCHIEDDWILIYELGTNADGREITIFHATGTHENLFG